MQKRDCFRNCLLIEVGFHTISNRVLNFYLQGQVKMRKADKTFPAEALMEVCDTADLAIVNVVNGSTLGDANGSCTHHSATTENGNLGGHSLVDYFVFLLCCCCCCFWQHFLLLLIGNCSKTV
jgi:hypothetical protein